MNELLDLIIDNTIHYQAEQSVEGAMDFEAFLTIIERTRVELDEK